MLTILLLIFTIIRCVSIIKCVHIQFMSGLPTFLNKNFHLPAINYDKVSRKLYENGKSFVVIINRKFVNFAVTNIWVRMPHFCHNF